MNNLLTRGILLSSAGGGAVDLIMMIVPFILIFVAMYFFMMRPQKKRDKAIKAMLDALKVGDRVLTIGGIYGTVTGVKDDQIIIAVGAQKTVMNMARWAIKSVEDAPLENDREPEI